MSPRSERWTDDYETTTFRGPRKYPVPGDWLLGHVEMDGIEWRRYDDAPDDVESKHDIDHEILYEGPDDELWTLNDWYPETDETTVKVNLNNDPVFTVTNPDEDDLMAAIAEVLTCVVEGDDPHAVEPPKSLVEPEPEEEEAQNSALGDFA